jgi:4-diphosphocytidyl-2-C-methyl-D-erythritol kinase
MANQYTRITLPAPAKINLFLHIIGKRLDGYHNLQTVFQFLDFSDNLHFQVNDTGLITLHSALPGTPPHDNLIYKAAQLLKTTTQCPLGVTIELDKKIPMGSGLGGGSSDAATTLLALNTLWQLNLTQAELLTLGRQLGADVNIFIAGIAAFAEGIGDEFTPLETIPTPWYVILVPDAHVSTIAMYTHPDLPRNTPEISAAQYLQQKPSSNDFTQLACEQHPIIAHALAWLGQFGEARMTGSGCALFLPCENQTQALDIVGQIPYGMIGFAAQGQNRSPLKQALAALNGS